MFKKQQIVYLLIGLIIGILSTPIFSFANQQIKIILNGNQIENADAIIINSTTYIPLRKIAEELNLLVEWDGVNRQVILQSQSQNNYNTTMEIEESVNTDNSEVDTNKNNYIGNNNYNISDINNTITQDSIIKTTFKEMQAIIYDGITYFSYNDWVKQLENNNKTVFKFYTQNRFKITINDEIFLVPKVNTKTYENNLYIDINYYRN